MKKKGILAAVAIGLICLFTGCEKTPEDVIVKQKGQKDITSYAKEDEGEGAVSLAEQLLAPQSYQDEAVSDDGKLKIVLDASVDIPEVNRFPIYKVKEKELTQEFIDAVTETFFGDVPVYGWEEYFTQTKDEIANLLAELKEELAAERFDFETAGSGYVLTEEAYKERLQVQIDELEKEYEAAPEARLDEEVKPEMVFGGLGDTKNYVVEVDPDHIYEYRIQDFNGYTIRIDRRNAPWTEYYALKDANQIDMAETEVKALAGIGLEEAKVWADEKLAALGLADMELYEWEYVILLGEAVFQGQDAGYLLHYTRKVSDIPVTYTNNTGGCIESMAYENVEDERETWWYERVDILLSEDGIEQVDIKSLYDLGGEEVSSIQMMEFKEIMEIFKNMMLISNAEVTMQEERSLCHMNRISLGYMRIYEPETDSKSGTLIPVWDFFGWSESDYVTAEGNGTDKNTDKSRSYLTINALDGTLIDRELGY